MKSYRTLQLLNANYNTACGWVQTWILFVGLMCHGVINTSIIELYRTLPLVSVLAMCLATIFLALIEEVILSNGGKLFETSSSFKLNLSLFKNKGAQADSRSCSELRSQLGTLFFIRNTTTVSVFNVLSNYTLTLLLSKRRNQEALIGF